MQPVVFFYFCYSLDVLSHNTIYFLIFLALELLILNINLFWLYSWICFCFYLQASFSCAGCLCSASQISRKAEKPGFTWIPGTYTVTSCVGQLSWKHTVFFWLLSIYSSLWHLTESSQTEADVGEALAMRLDFIINSFQKSIYP